MTSRHLLVRGGRGSFPPLPTVHTLTTAPEGGWAIPAPAAYQYNGYVYFCYVQQTGNVSVRVAAVPLSTYVTGTPQTMRTPSVLDDGHNAPSLLVDSVSHKLVIAYADHEDTRARVRVSVNSLDTDPTLSGGFTAEWHGADAPINTYAMLVQLRGVTDSPIYLFIRDLPNTTQPTTTRFGYYRSIDLFATDPPYVRVFTAGTGNRSYWDIGSDWSTRIEVFPTQGDAAVGGQASVSLHHFYINGTAGTYHKSDGTTISAGLPFTTADMTQIYDGSTGTPFPSGSVTDAVLGPSVGFLASHASGGHATRQARYRSGSWGIVEVIADNGHASGTDQTWPSLTTDPFDANRLWTSRLTSTKLELSEFRSSDDGATWTETVITSGSSTHNSNPEAVYFANSGLRVIWVSGAPNSYDIKGLQHG